MAQTKKQQISVLIRTYSAGVHFGVLEERNGKEVRLSGARRLWRWEGANTLNEVATVGVKKGSRVSEPVDSILLLEAIEIIELTPAALESLTSVGWAK